MYAPLAGFAGARGATTFGMPPFPGAVASLPSAFPGPRNPAQGPGFSQQPSLAAWGGPTCRAPVSHLTAGASALPDMQALSQLVAHQVAQQLWGSQHLPLRIYWRWTSTLCTTRCCLFISWKKGYAQDFRPSSVSRWLAQVISAAYARSGSDLPGVVPRPHEVRAWASSQAFAKSRSPHDIMEAVYWPSPATFIQFYLWDMSSVRDDGSYGVASAVVAQQAVFPSKKHSHDLKNLKPGTPSFLVVPFSTRESRYSMCN